MSSDNQGQLSPHRAKSLIYQPNKVCVTDKKKVLRLWQPSYTRHSTAQQNLVGGAITILKHMKVKGKDYPWLSHILWTFIHIYPYIMDNKIHVWNHQPETYTFKQQQHLSRFSLGTFMATPQQAPESKAIIKVEALGGYHGRNLGCHDLSGKIDTINNSSGIGNYII